MLGKTIAKWVERRVYQARQSAQRPSKLDSFKGQIVAQLERHPYTAQQLLQQLKTQGYAGGYSILKEFVRLVRPVRKPAFLMLEFAPGECAQVDWGSFGLVPVGSARRRLSFFIMVLCHTWNKNVAMRSAAATPGWRQSVPFFTTPATCLGQSCPN